MTQIFLADLVCVMSLHQTRRDGFVNFDVCRWMPVRRNSVLDGDRVKEFDDIQDELMETAHSRSDMVDEKFVEMNRSEIVEEPHERHEMGDDIVIEKNGAKNGVVS